VGKSSVATPTIVPIKMNDLAHVMKENTPIVENEQVKIDRLKRDIKTV